MPWHDLRKENPLVDTQDVAHGYLKIEFPAFFECDSEKKNTHLLLDLEKLCGIKSEGLIPYPVDLESDQKDWKWKLNPKDNEHYEDLLMWAQENKPYFIPDDYQYYPKDYKNRWRKFRDELPAIGANIIVSLKLSGRIYREKNGYGFSTDTYVSCLSPLDSLTIKNDLKSPNINWNWKGLWEK